MQARCRCNLSYSYILRGCAIVKKFHAFVRRWSFNKASPIWELHCNSPASQSSLSLPLSLFTYSCYFYTSIIPTFIPRFMNKPAMWCFDFSIVLCRYQYYPLRDICGIRYIAENIYELRRDKHTPGEAHVPTVCDSFHSILVIVSTRMAAYNNRTKTRSSFYGRYPPIASPLEI